MKDVKVTLCTNDLKGNPMVQSYNTYLSAKALAKKVKELIASGMEFTIVNSYTKELIAQNGVQ